ncbi:MAG TPA: hypothetical protein VHC63_18080 [Acidimicrobiales bacterium]|nr:hypothetical protein [Acidimicrobiales bacterium]
MRSNATRAEALAKAVQDGDGAANEPHDADINDNGVPDDQDPTIAFFQTDDVSVAAKPKGLHFL